MPNSAVSTMRRFCQLVKDSVSGALECLPSAFIFRKAGDSCIDSRIQVEMASSTSDSRKGRRQPHSSKAGPVSLRQARITSSDSSRPAVAVTWIQLV